jgi:hypothetical protein
MLFAMTKPPAYDHLLTLEEAEERLKPHQDRLNRCIQHGWDAYMKDYTAKHLILSARSRATIVFDEIIARAEAEFSRLEGVKFVRKSNSFLLYIGDKITLRFKKIKKCGRCSNIDTRQQVLFKAQAQMYLPTMLEGTLLQAGYVLDELQREIDRKMVVCQLNNRVLWQFRLTGTSNAIVEMTPSVPQQPEPSKARFEVKEDLGKKKNEEKGKGAGAGE